MQERYLVIIIVSLMLISLIGCTETVSNSLSPLNATETDSIVGIIARIETGEFGKRILVEENVEVTEPLDPGGKKTWYTISEQSDLFRQTGKNSHLEIGVDELKTDQIVWAWSTGIHMLSYPTQTGAKRIIVLKQM